MARSQSTTDTRIFSPLLVGFRLFSAGSSPTSGDWARMAEPFAGLGALDDLPVIQHQHAVDDHE
jgi:hypothetical protein